VTLFTSGWLMDNDTARQLAASVAGICVSVDGVTEQVHDAIRGRRGSFRNAMATLRVLDGFKRERVRRGWGRGKNPGLRSRPRAFSEGKRGLFESETCYNLGIDYTVTRSNQDGTERFVEEMTSRFPSVDFIRFGAVVPEGLAQEEDFVRRELLTMEELVALGD